MREVRLGVLPGVEDHGHVRGLRWPAGRRAYLLVLAGELADHAGELGDVRPVAGVGVPGQRDPAVPGHHQAQPGQPEVGAFLLGLAALRHRRLAVGGGDEGGEVRHVQRYRGHVYLRGLHDPGRDRTGRLLHLLQGDGVHRVPEPAVIQHPGGNPGEPVSGSGLPPVRERQLRAWRDQPVQCRQRQVRADAGAGVGTPRSGRLIDDRGDPQILKHAPGGGDVPECQVPGPLRHDRGLPGIQQRLDLRRGAQVPLGDQLRLAIDPAHFAQVPVRLPADHLLVQACHDFRS